MEYNAIDLSRPSSGIERVVSLQLQNGETQKRVFRQNGTLKEIQQTSGDLLFIDYFGEDEKFIRRVVKDYHPVE